MKTHILALLTILALVYVATTQTIAQEKTARGFAMYHDSDCAELHIVLSGSDIQSSSLQETVLIAEALPTPTVPLMVAAFLALCRRYLSRRSAGTDSLDLPEHNRTN